MSNYPGDEVARAAFDVMMRRKWMAINPPWQDKGWCVTNQRRQQISTQHWPDPFTAVVEADKWFATNVEGKPC